MATTSNLTNRDAVLARLEALKKKPPQPAAPTAEGGEPRSSVSKRGSLNTPSVSVGQAPPSFVPPAPELSATAAHDLFAPKKKNKPSSDDGNGTGGDNSTKIQLSAEEDSFLEDAANIEILSKLGDMNIQDDHGLTALQRACLKGHAALVEMVVLLGADVNMATATEATPLVIAEREGHQDIVNILNQYGASRHGTNDARACDFDRGCVVC
jgi:ankyrin repeat protein